MKSQLADITLAHMREYDIPGVALAVVRDGQIVHEFARSVFGLEPLVPVAAGSTNDADNTEGSAD